MGNYMFLYNFDISFKAILFCSFCRPQKIKLLFFVILPCIWHATLRMDVQPYRNDSLSVMILEAF